MPRDIVHSYFIIENLDGQELEGWLETNVLVIPGRKLSLYCFDVNWSEWSGKFKVKFDDVEFHESLVLGLTKTAGRHSLLSSSPSTFQRVSAIRLTETTKLAIDGLGSTFLD